MMTARQLRNGLAKLRSLDFDQFVAVFCGVEPTEEDEILLQKWSEFQTDPLVVVLSLDEQAFDRVYHFMRAETEVVSFKTYVTFGQSHVHVINGHTLNKDRVAVIPCTNAAEGRAKAFEFFGPKFFTTYFDTAWKEEEMLKYFSGGYVEVA